MFEKFSEEAIKVIMHAQEEARILKHRHVGCEHLLLGLVAAGQDSASYKLLSSVGLDLTKLREAVGKAHKKGTKASPKEMPFDRDAKIVLENAFRVMMNSKQTIINSEHLLLGLLVSGENSAIKILEELGVTRNDFS